MSLPNAARTADGIGLILIHIGNGEWNGDQEQCVNGSSQSGNVTVSLAIAAGGGSRETLGLRAQSYGTLCATSLTAPLVSCNWTAAPGFTNPTLWVQSNGSIVTGGNSNYSLALSYGSNCTKFACSVWPTPVEVTPSRTGEDPWIWQVCCTGSPSSGRGTSSRSHSTCAK